MNIRNSLDTPVFQDQLDFRTLENILECLDYVTPKKISRSEYKSMQGKFLVETGEDKFGKSYDLFLPEDLVHGELLHIIDFLSKKFLIESYTSYSRIITKTKVMVGAILRGVGEKEGEIYLQELAEKYSISPEFITRLKSQKEGGEKMSFSQTKEMIKSIKSNRKNPNNEKVGSNDEDITLGFEELKELYGNEFDLTFFRKGVNMLRLGMMTITRAEQEGLRKRGEFQGETISFRVEDSALDEKEKLLRDKIGIDELKRELEEARNYGNQEQINEAELKATNRILEVLYEYPYQATNKENGYKPSKIAELKEVYCVGFCSLGHAFLSELGIKHNGLFNDAHIALEVIIGGKSYCFDSTRNDNLTMCNIYNSNGIFKKLSLMNIEIELLQGDIEKLILSSILHNIMVEKIKHYKDHFKFIDIDIYKNVVDKLFQKCIRLYPYNPAFYMSIAKFYIFIGDIEKAKKILSNGENTINNRS